jgi:hypothetical protein
MVSQFKLGSVAGTAPAPETARKPNRPVGGPGISFTPAGRPNGNGQLRDYQHGQPVALQ